MKFILKIFELNWLNNEYLKILVFSGKILEGWSLFLAYVCIGGATIRRRLSAQQFPSSFLLIFLPSPH